VNIHESTKSILNAKGVSYSDVRDDGDAGSKVADVVLDAIHELVDAEDKLRDLAVTLQRRLTQTVERLDGGQHVNELGELQGASIEFDSLCRLRQARVSFLTKNVALYVRLRTEGNLV
jgi:hypothetical protein